MFTSLIRRLLGLTKIEETIPIGPPLNLYKVRVNIAYDIVVAAPSAEIAQHPDVLRANSKHLIPEIEDHLDELARENISLQTITQVQSLEDIPASYVDNLPFEHPDFSMKKDISCKEMLENPQRLP